ncbi:MAG: aspartyl/glutamyl-tRNA amidotransferase subunit A [Candidatus Hepatoplasma vulgare]|nr:MAG: aspartyl/glutamyl-tRNA amidotransferase subunit A [Candidatus Hepatoplasma sp.]
MKNNPRLSPLNIDNKIKKNKVQPLKNMTFALKDNFAVRNIPTTGGTKLLENFKITYNSTVYEKLIKAGAKPITKANLDELAMGFSGLTSGFGVVLNPYDGSKIIGGSSSGSAYLIANKEVDFSIGSDTGDSVRKPAWYVGITAFKPTWGIVSRYGLFDFSPSWDTVGWFSKNVDDSALLLDVLQGKDEKDFTSLNSREKDFLKDINNIKKEDVKLGYIKSFLDDIKDKDILNKFNDLILKLKKDGFNIVEIDLDLKLFKTILTVYRIISSVNGFSSNSNLTSFLFGNFELENDEFKNEITRIRSNFVYEVKKRFLLSSEVFLNKKNLYNKARKIRHLYINALSDLFAKIDAIIMPPAGNYAPSIKDAFNAVKYNSIMDEYLGIFNANGSPSLNIPILKNIEKPFSVNIATAPFNDKKCLQIGKLLEKYER